jgi:aerobic carbon-monoxide dehydrogenase small subunit
VKVRRTKYLELISFLLNGRKQSVYVEPSDSLNHVIREKLGLTGTKRGCETGGCGSCTVLVDDAPVYSCMMYAMQAEGRKITTVEGLVGLGGELDPVQKSFMENGGLQCGYCTPGFIMSTKGLLLANSNPIDSEIRDALVGNLCRCTGYTKIFESVRAAAESLRANRKENK